MVMVAAVAGSVFGFLPVYVLYRIDRWRIEHDLEPSYRLVRS